MSAAIPLGTTIGDLLPRPAASGTIVNVQEGLLILAFSYNPRRDAYSRRKWARDTAARFAQLPRQAFLTLTTRPEWHGVAATWEMLAYEANAVRLFKQLVDRWLQSVCSEEGRCVVCIRKPVACRGKHRGRRWSLNGRCAQCGRWQRLEWWSSRWVFACSACLSSPRMRALPKDRRKPVCVLNWSREMMNKLGQAWNPHRHCQALMPFIPQDLLSEFAARAGLGEVLDVRVDRAETAARGGLEDYLAKQARTYVPSHPMLAGYFTKQAAEPDAFNALPLRAARIRINYPVSKPNKKSLPPGSFFARGVGIDEARIRWLPWTLDRLDPNWFPPPEGTDVRAGLEKCGSGALNAKFPEQLALILPRPPSHNPQPLE